MRHLHKSWQDKRPGWTRRVRWYESEVPNANIRLCFEEGDGRINRIYPDYVSAQADFNAFVNRQTSVLSMLTEGLG